MSHSPLMPPVPFADFDFTFDPALSNLFPPPPPLPSSADLFSPSETTDLFGFLDNFNWEFDPSVPDPTAYQEVPQLPQLPQLGQQIPSVPQQQPQQQKTLPPYNNPHLNTTPEPFISSGRRASMRNSTRARAHTIDSSNLPHLDTSMAYNPLHQGPQSATPTQRYPSGSVDDTAQSQSPASVAARAKPLLSTPQKRLNHIMSEQKRRNAIRDGYASLIALLAPAGAPPGLGMPTRGRPKGSGSRGKGRSKGKSGVLFRAVEYTKWLEEGRDKLRVEVAKVEAAAGIHAA